MNTKYKNEAYLEKEVGQILGRDVVVRTRNCELRYRPGESPERSSELSKHSEHRNIQETLGIQFNPARDFFELPKSSSCNILVDFTLWGSHFEVLKFNPCGCEVRQVNSPRVEPSLAYSQAASFSNMSTLVIDFCISLALYGYHNLQPHAPKFQ